MSDFMQGDKDNAISVPFSDDESAEKPDDLLEEDPVNATPQERVQRKQRRLERTKRLIQDGKQSAEELRILKAQHDVLRGEMERLKGYIAAQPVQRPANDTKDPYEARLDAVYAKQAEAYTAAQAEIKAQTFTPERQKHYEKLARDIETEKTAIHTERAIASQSAQQRSQSARAVWENKYPEVYGNSQAYQFAEATFRRRLALGERQTNELVDEVMNEAMTTFRLGPKRAPSASDRAKLSGMPSAGGSGGNTPRNEGITMTPELRRLAIARYSDVPEAEAIKKWVNGPGKRLREKKVI